LILLWEAGDDVTLIDAVMSGAPPGTVHERDLLLTPLPAEMAAATTHTLGLRDGVELARALQRLPASLRFIGIEGQDFRVGQGLSAPVLAALERVVAMVLEGR
jgi:hydrogenase maturation protease